MGTTPSMRKIVGGPTHILTVLHATLLTHSFDETYAASAGQVPETIPRLNKGIENRADKVLAPNSHTVCARTSFASTRLEAWTEHTALQSTSKLVTRVLGASANRR